MKIQIYSKKKLIYLLKEWAQKHGETPSKRQWNEDVFTPSDMPFRKMFGSWGKALKVAGLKAKEPTPPYIGRKVGSKNKKLKMIISHGYIHIFKPDHPEAMKNGYVRQHRMVASDFLGRLLKRTEDVHHINGNKLDNRIENLEIIAHDSHTSLHWKGAKRKPFSEKHKESIRNHMKGNKNWAGKKSSAINLRIRSF